MVKMEANTGKRNLLDMSPPEIMDFCLSLDEKKYRGRQVASWIFRRGVESLEQMTDIAKATRAKMAEHVYLKHLNCLELQEDDEAKKILWELEDGQTVESVLIRERDHMTLCISSQVGCALGCRFCRTGTMGFIRNLSQGEIIGQVIGAQKLLRGNEQLTNIVFMGMGEPLLNRENVTKAIGIICDSDYLAFAKKHVSLSTVGIVPELPRLAEGPEIGLTVSLSAPTDELRDKLMPINRKYPLKQLKEALAAWPLAHARRITVAYVLLKGVNDSPETASKLSRFLAGLKVKINLIPFNPWPGAPFEAPSFSAVNRFKEILTDKNHTVMVRWSKGGKVSAACGQLAGERKNTICSGEKESS